MTTAENKMISRFEKYIGHSSNLFDLEDWNKFDAFVAGTNMALEVAAEKVKIKEFEINFEWKIEIDKESILNCLK